MHEASSCIENNLKLLEHVNDCCIANEQMNIDKNSDTAVMLCHRRLPTTVPLHIWSIVTKFAKNAILVYILYFPYGMGKSNNLGELKPSSES